MKKTRFLLLLLALVPVVAHAQADQKLINKAHQGDPKAMVLLGECYEDGAGVEVDSATALKWFQKAANMGDGLGWVSVSRYYLTGSCGMPKDSARYFAIRKEWAGRNEPDAVAALALSYEYGIGTKVDTAKARELYEQSVKMGSAWGYNYMGTNYCNGFCGYEKNEKKGVAMWQKAYKLGQHAAAGRLAGYYCDHKDYKSAWKWAEEGMKWGVSNATIVAARMYAVGLGVAKDEAKAQQMMSQLIAKRHNLGWAQYVAGAMYMYPDSAALRDSAKAMRIWEEGSHFAPSYSSSCQMQLGREYAGMEQYEKSYELFRTVGLKKRYEGDGEACLNMAKLLFGGYGCDTDTAAAIGWLERGVEVFEDAACALSLAGVYESFDGYKDMPKAVSYYRLADKYGDEDAMAYLGGMYERNGNSDQAIECYDAMIAKGQADGYYYKGLAYDRMGKGKECNKLLAQGDKAGSHMAQEALGKVYENGFDEVKVDYKKAAAYYTKAQTSYAKYRMALMYLRGNLGKKSEKDIALGLDYLKQSAKEGCIDAIYDLGVCYETGTFVDTVQHEKALELFQLLADNDVAAGQFKVGLYNELGDGGIEADTAKAIEYYQKAADQNFALAKVYLGDFYLLGKGMPKDEAKAFALYTEAHEAGEEHGTYYVGKSYLEGWSVPVDTLMAMPYLKAAAHQGVGESAYEVAQIYNYGQASVVANGDSALAYYLLGHQGGSGAASYVIGRQLLNEEAYDQATEFLYVGARRGNVDAMVTFATCLQQGIGFKEADPKEAYKVFELAANQYHDARAYQQLGLACLQGNGCPQDESLAKTYLDTAASMDNVQAFFYLGLCYLNGLGCIPDTAAAISWLERAADNEHVRAINVLGDVYEAQEDFKNAVLYFEKAIALGSLEGYCNLGYCYEQGQGVVLNSQKAFELYKFAADHDHARGCRCVAGCYVQGIYVAQNLAEALVWYSKAAAMGDVRAMYYCGAILEEGGEGVPADPKAARKWYKLAAEQGYEPAAAALSRMK